MLENIRSLYNVGSIFRTADGVGLTKILLTGITPYPTYTDDQRKPWEITTITEKLHKTALGAEEFVAWEYVEKPENALSLKQANLNCSVVSLEKTDTSISIFDADMLFPILFIVGNEKDGISQKTLSQSDHIVHIPMYGKKESFNEASATAIALYELRRKFVKLNSGNFR